MQPKCAIAIGVSVAAAKLQGVEKYKDYQFEQLLSEETHKETEHEEDNLMTDQDNTDEFDLNTDTCIS